MFCNLDESVPNRLCYSVSPNCRREDATETPPQTCVAPLCERMHQFWTEYSQEVIGAASCTKTTEPTPTGCPSTKEFATRAHHDPPTFCPNVLAQIPHCPKGSLSWQIRTSPHSGCGVCFLRQSFENVTTFWTHTRCVPHLGFPLLMRIPE